MEFWSISYKNRLISFSYPFLVEKTTNDDYFDHFLADRIDSLSIKANIRLEKGSELDSFIDSLEGVHSCLNNLEEHLHAFTNFYIPLDYGKFANISL